MLLVNLVFPNADLDGWVGGAVQLTCVSPGAPLGGPFRFHVRLFRQG